MRTDHEVAMNDDRTMSSIDMDNQGFYCVSEEKMGILCTLILAG